MINKNPIHIQINYTDYLLTSFDDNYMDYVVPQMFGYAKDMIKGKTDELYNNFFAFDLICLQDNQEIQSIKVSFRKLEAIDTLNKLINQITPEQVLQKQTYIGQLHDLNNIVKKLKEKENEFNITQTLEDAMQYTMEEFLSTAKQNHKNESQLERAIFDAFTRGSASHDPTIYNKRKVFRSIIKYFYETYPDLYKQYETDFMMIQLNKNI